MLSNRRAGVGSSSSVVRVRVKVKAPEKQNPSVFIFLFILFQRPSIGFSGEEIRDRHSRKTHPTKQHQRCLHPNSPVLPVVRGPQEAHGSDDGPDFSGGAGDSMAGGTEPSGKELGGENESGGVGAEI